MTPIEALTILATAAQRALLSLPDHRKALEAVDVLNKAISPPVEEEPDVED